MQIELFSTEICHYVDPNLLTTTQLVLPSLTLRTLPVLRAGSQGQARTRHEPTEQLVPRMPRQELIFWQPLLESQKLGLMLFLFPPWPQSGQQQQ